MNTVLYTILVSLGVAFILGLLLGLFKHIFEVKEDEKVIRIREALSGANCGACGAAGCDLFAKLVAENKASPAGCIAGGAEVASKINAILGTSSVAATPKVALVACAGDKEVAKLKGVYNGVKTCQAVSLAVGGIKSCQYGCIGYGDCVTACSFHAIKMGESGLPIIDYDKCVGCGKCASTCPKHLITIYDKTTKGSIALCCNRSDNKAGVRKDCTKGCFKCSLCVRKCPEHCIELVEGVPKVDYTKCTSCGECVKACPDKVLHLMQEIIKNVKEEG